MRAPSLSALKIALSFLLLLTLPALSQKKPVEQLPQPIINGQPFVNNNGNEIGLSGIVLGKSVGPMIDNLTARGYKITIQNEDERSYFEHGVQKNYRLEPKTLKTTSLLKSEANGQERNSDQFYIRDTGDISGSQIIHVYRTLRYEGPDGGPTVDDFVSQFLEKFGRATRNSSETGFVNFIWYFDRNRSVIASSARVILEDVEINGNKSVDVRSGESICDRAMNAGVAALLHGNFWYHIGSRRVKTAEILVNDYEICKLAGDRMRNVAAQAFENAVAAERKDLLERSRNAPAAPRL